MDLSPLLVLLFMSKNYDLYVTLSITLLEKVSVIGARHTNFAKLIRENFIEKSIYLNLHLGVFYL
jgi:hypothetical protein